MPYSDLLTTIETSMLDFIEQVEEEDYTAKDVATCLAILRDYLNEIDEAIGTPGGLAAAKKAVLRLNELNERCNEVLIETGQREDIAELMNTAYLDQAFALPDSGDVTEEWREW